MSWLKGLGLFLVGSAISKSAKNRARRKFHARVERDQSKISTGFKNFISPVNNYGTCFKCEGSGSITLTCKVCSGSGTYTGNCGKCEGTGAFNLPERRCSTCEGTGKYRGRPCLECNETGIFRSASVVPCRGCDGTGDYSSSCKKSGGSGNFKASCAKCGGSGWHKFRS